MPSSKTTTYRITDTGGSITLQDLRDLVRDTAEAPGNTRVRVHEEDADRPWDSGTSSIEVEVTT